MRATVNPGKNTVAQATAILLLALLLVLCSDDLAGRLRDLIAAVSVKPCASACGACPAAMCPLRFIP